MRSQFPLPCLDAGLSQVHVEISPECVPMQRISHFASEENPIRWQRLRCTFVSRSQQLQSPPRKKNPAGFPPFGSPMVPSSFTARSTNTPPKSGRTNSHFSALTSWPRIPYVAIRMKNTAQYKTLGSSVESLPFTPSIRFACPLSLPFSLVSRKQLVQLLKGNAPVSVQRFANGSAS